LCASSRTFFSQCAFWHRVLVTRIWKVFLASDSGLLLMSARCSFFFFLDVPHFAGFAFFLPGVSGPRRLLDGPTSTPIEPSPPRCKVIFLFAVFGLLPGALLGLSAKAVWFSRFSVNFCDPLFSGQISILRLFSLCFLLSFSFELIFSCPLFFCEWWSFGL